MNVLNTGRQPAAELGPRAPCWGSLWLSAVTSCEEGIVARGAETDVPSAVAPSGAHSSGDTRFDSGDLTPIM